MARNVILIVALLIIACTGCGGPQFSAACQQRFDDCSKTCRAICEDPQGARERDKLDRTESWSPACKRCASGCIEDARRCDRRSPGQ